MVATIFVRRPSMPQRYVALLPSPGRTGDPASPSRAWRHRLVEASVHLDVLRPVRAHDEHVDPAGSSASATPSPMGPATARAATP